VALRFYKEVYVDWDVALADEVIAILRTLCFARFSAKDVNN